MCSNVQSTQHGVNRNPTCVAAATTNVRTTKRCGHLRTSARGWSDKSVGRRRTSHRTPSLSLSPSLFLPLLLRGAFLEECNNSAAGSRTQVASMATMQSTTRPLMTLRPLCKQDYSLRRHVAREPAMHRRSQVFCVTSVGTPRWTGRSHALLGSGIEPEPSRSSV